MSIRPIVTLGSPVLHQRGAAVDSSSPATRTLVENLIATLRAEAAGIGLAAPQIGVGKRVFVAHVPQSKTGHLPLTVFINPKLEPTTDKKINMFEGCLSIPGVNGVVPRYESVRVEFTDDSGSAKVAEASGFLAGLLQHEYDHVEGKVFLQRVRSAGGLLSADELAEAAGSEEFIRKHAIVDTGTFSVRDAA